MLPKFGWVTPEEVTRLLERVGFRLVRQSDRHAVLWHPDGKWTTVPTHPEKGLGRGLMAKILKDLERLRQGG